MAAAPGLHPRFAESQLAEALLDTPVVAVNGARQVGKSTLVSALLEPQRPAVYVTLDDETQLAAAERDPYSFVDRSDLLVIDEVQRAPGLLAAIKAQVDRDRRPGRYLLTGSTRLLSTPEVSESLVGRVEILDLWPLSQGEIAGHRDEFVGALFGWSPSLFRSSPIRRADYLERVTLGGLPEPLTREGRRRASWFRNYTTTVVQRMVADVADIERLDVMPRLLQLCAARTANELNIQSVANDVGLPHRTVGNYLAHLQSVFMVIPIPAWSRNVTSRVVHRPKIVIVDSGVAAYLVGMDAAAMAEPGGATMAGHLVETFVTMELRKQLGWSEVDAQLYHFRDRAGAEVDLVLESRDGRVAGVEVKASSTVRAEDFRGLRVLQERLGAQFAGGVVLYTGPDAVPFGERLAAVPLSALWEAEAATG